MDAWIPGGRSTYQFIERHLVGFGQRQEKFEVGPALAGLQPREGADRDPGGLRQC